MPRPEKVAAVDELAEKLQSGQGIVIADYRGLTVKEMTDLRSELRKVGVEFKVVKNTLTLLAAEKVEIEGLDSVLEGPTAIAFGYDDPVAAAKTMSEFAKKNDKLQVKGGILTGKVIDAEGVKALADLPRGSSSSLKCSEGCKGRSAAWSTCSKARCATWFTSWKLYASKKKRRA